MTGVEFTALLAAELAALNNIEARLVQLGDEAHQISEVHMKTDVNGCSTTGPGQEQWDEFTSSLFNGKRIQYDYRTPGGKLFSCIAKSLDDARGRRDAWLAKEGAQ